MKARPPGKRLGCQRTANFMILSCDELVVLDSFSCSIILSHI